MFGGMFLVVCNCSNMIYVQNTTLGEIMKWKMIVNVIVNICLYVHWTASAAK